MINRSEIDQAAELFGAPDTQIIRDHLISHVLAALSDWPDNDHVTFFGGTALCRTWLPDHRLSEDVDLLLDSPADGEPLRQHVSRRLRREFPNLEWARLDTQHQVETWTLAAEDVEVNVQLAQWRFGWQTIPLVKTAVALRYSDLSPTVPLTVPAPNGFAAMKFMAWFDRYTPRDLFDLAALADAGHIDTTSLELVRTIAGFTPNTTNLGNAVPRTVQHAWQAELSHQLSRASTADECLTRVRNALTQLNPTT